MRGKKKESKREQPNIGNVCFEKSSPKQLHLNRCWHVTFFFKDFIFNLAKHLFAETEKA